MAPPAGRGKWPQLRSYIRIKVIILFRHDKIYISQADSSNKWDVCVFGHGQKAPAHFFAELFKVRIDGLMCDQLVLSEKIPENCLAIFKTNALLCMDLWGALDFARDGLYPLVLPTQAFFVSHS